MDRNAQAKSKYKILKPSVNSANGNIVKTYFTDIWTELTNSIFKVKCENGKFDGKNFR